MSVDLLLPAAVNAPAVARRALSGQVPLPPDRAYLAALLVSELVTNSVRHARLHESETVRLRIACEDDTVRVEVEDHGPGFDPGERRPRRPRGLGLPVTEGYGLQLVDDLADRWGVDCERCTRVWFELDLTQPVGHAALS
jgi:anti-sigma regulatory factor (Ser/Thr protein kinase)